MQTAYIQYIAVAPRKRCVSRNANNGKTIDVFDDYEIGMVFVKSQVNLENIFEREQQYERRNK